MKLLQDIRTGEPVIDFDGNLLETDLNRSFNQYIDVLLHTPIGEEIALIGWGIPYRELFKIKFSYNWEHMVRYLLIEALNPQREPLIDHVESIDLTRATNAIDIDLHVVSVYNDKTELKVSLNE